MRTYTYEKFVEGMKQIMKVIDSYTSYINHTKTAEEVLSVIESYQNTVPEGIRIHLDEFKLTENYPSINKVKEVLEERVADKNL